MDLYSDLPSKKAADDAESGQAALPTANTWTMGASKLMAPPVVRRAPQPKTVPPVHRRIVSHTSVTVVQEVCQFVCV